jgi:hypothetical protein
MYLTVGAPRLQAEERVVVRATAADPRSDWAHGFSSGTFFLTDRRLFLQPWAVLGGNARPSWELTLDAVDRVSSVRVPVWLFGLVCVWLHGIRLVTLDGKARTVIVGRARAEECVTTLEGVLRARRRSSQRTGATSTS